MYLHDSAHSSRDAESPISTGNVGGLNQKWTASTGATIAASAVVANGLVYVGSWDGNEYAFDANSGNQIWKTYLGMTNDPNCSPNPLGITSSPTVTNGMLYVGGGDNNWYALNARTGAIEWNISVGDNSPSGGLYNYASPLIANGYAYIGLSSDCDNPAIQGQLLQVDLGSHSIVNRFAVVSNGNTGGSIWSSPAYDPETNTVFITTGNPDQDYGESFVALDGSSLSVKGSWQIPASQEASADNDIGASPLLFTDANGRHLVGAPSKNGIFYAFDRNNLGNGPVWTVQLANGGDSPESGDGSIASGAFDGSTVYVGGGNIAINGTSYAGSLQAINPSNGQVMWAQGLAGTVVSAAAVANGVVLVGTENNQNGGQLVALNAQNGSVLFSMNTAGHYAPPIIAAGHVYIGALDGTFYALAP